MALYLLVSCCSLLMFSPEKAEELTSVIYYCRMKLIRFVSANEHTLSVVFTLGET